MKKLICTLLISCMKIFVFAISLFCVVGMQGCSKTMIDTASDAGERIMFSPEESFEDAMFDADDGMEWCRKQEVVVFEDGRCVSGKKVWDTFYDLVNKGEAASVLCAHYYTLQATNIDAAFYEDEKDQYPKLFFNLVVFDGIEFCKQSRKSNEKIIDSEVRYKYLLHLTGKNPSTAQHKYYDNYVLVNDPSVTWEQIMASVYSSQSDAWIEHYTVYNDRYD